MKRILLVNQYTTKIFLDIVNAFLKDDYEVILFTGNHDFPEIKNDKFKIIQSIKYKRSNWLARLSTWILFSLHFFLYVIFSGRKKSILLASNPPFVFFVAWLVKIIKGCNYYLLVYDLYPDVIYNMGFLSEKNVSMRLWNKLNKPVFNKSNLIFTISDGLKDLIKARTSTSIKVINNWGDNNHLKPLPKSQNWFAKKYDSINKLTLMYSGNFGLTHGLEAILKVSRKLNNNPNIQFFLIGEGSKKKRIVGEIKKYHLDKVNVLPFQPYENLQYTLTTADFGIVMLDERAENVSVPSKTYYLLAAGCALLCIASPDSELGKIVKKYKIGVVFRPNEIDEIVKFIQNVTTDELNKYKANALKASKDFTPKNADFYVKSIEKFHG
ncbi:MAG: glycosyltransferase family 4 protein [Fulvivirga sp.]|nr:glycosyltransferase family 4 protein [Fulvivirga sp.]